MQVAALTGALAGGGGQLTEGDELGDPRGGHLWLLEFDDSQGFGRW